MVSAGRRAVKWAVGRQVPWGPLFNPTKCQWAIIRVITLEGPGDGGEWEFTNDAYESVIRWAITGQGIPPKVILK